MVRMFSGSVSETIRNVPGPRWPGLPACPGFFWRGLNPEWLTPEWVLVLVLVVLVVVLVVLAVVSS